MGVMLVASLMTLYVASPKNLSRPSEFPNQKHAAPALNHVDATNEAITVAKGKLDWARWPLRFEKNAGQAPASVRFSARGQGYTFCLSDREAILYFQKGRSRNSIKTDAGRRMNAGAVGAAPSCGTKIKQEQPTSVERLSIRWEGARISRSSTGLERLPTKSNYFIGNQPQRWRTDIPNFAKVRYEQVYPGIDLLFYGNQQQLEYDFIVAPQGNPAAITLAFQVSGSKARSQRLSLAQDGSLIIELAGGKLRQAPPVIYQEDGPHKTYIKGRYTLKGAHRVGFEVAAYDRSRPLVIDPVLSYSTYLGGIFDDIGADIQVDANGNAFLIGDTNSPGFPTFNAFQGSLFGGTDVFVTKIDATGSNVLYSAYLGGVDNEFGKALALDSNGNAYVTGETQSVDFPVSINAFQPAFGGFSVQGDAFVVRLNATGSALDYSSYLGGSGGEIGFGIAVDASGAAYVTGGTSSADFPISVNAFQSIFGTQGDVFVTKVSPSGNSVVYSTYLGGAFTENGLGIALDTDNQATITGFTNSPGYPLANAFQDELKGLNDVFVTRLNASGTDLIFSTFLGGDDDEAGNKVVLDALGNVYLAGEVRSDNFPLKAALQKSMRGLVDGFVTKMNPNGTGLIYSTYLGGGDTDTIRGLAVDPTNHAIVAGVTSSLGFPIAAPFQAAYGGGTSDAFVARFSTAGNTLEFSTFLGGSDTDAAFSIATDADGNAYVIGTTSSDDFLIKNALQTTRQGGVDTFVSKLVEVPQPFAVISGTPTSGKPPLNVTFDGSASIVTGGGSIQTYHWDFGDGTTTTTTTSGTSHTYTTAGTFTATLFITDDQGQASALVPLPISVGDNLISDPDLQLTKGQFNLNWGQHLRDDPADSFKLSGYINPAGFLQAFNGAEVSLSVNDVEMISATSLKSRRHPRQKKAGAGRAALADQKQTIRLKTNGGYSIFVSGTDLRDALGVRDTSEERTLPVKITLTFSGSPPDTAVVSGVVEVSYKSTAGASARGTFSFVKQDTLTGAFRAIRTTAAEQSGGGHKIGMTGFFTGEDGLDLAPTGDVSIMLGAGGSAPTITVPLSSLLQKGTSFTYSSKLGGVAELKKFQLNNARKKFVLSTNEVAGTGIPAAGIGGVTFDFPVVILVPTSSGTVRLESSIELFRKSNGTTKWKR